MKRSELLFAALLLPLDALMIFGAFLFSYYTRVESGALPVANVLPADRFWAISVLITLTWLVIFALLGLYTQKSTRRGLREFSRIVAGCGVGTLVVIAVIFFLRIDFFSRLVVLIAFVAAVALVAVARGLVRVLQRSFFRYGIGVRRAIIVGSGRTAEVLTRELQRADRGYRVIGFLHDDKQEVPGPRLGRLSDTAKILQRFRPDELIDADPDLSESAKLELINVAEDANVDFRFTSNMAEIATSRVSAVAIGGVPILTVQKTPLDGWGRLLKRLLDLGGALVALPLVGVAYVVIAVLIKSDSPGPVIFRQTRVGKQGREFTSYKFRSMVVDAEAQLKSLRKQNEASGPVFKMRQDPRVTTVGGWLRRTSLDELPQIINVWRGEMSLVGPRPPLPTEVATYDRLQRRRLTIKPGITGPWQVSGRSDVSFEEWVQLDLYYIQNWSLLLDVTILLKTVYVVLRRQGAY